MRNYVAVVDVALLVHRPTQFGLSGIFGKLFVFENFKKKENNEKTYVAFTTMDKTRFGIAIFAILVVGIFLTLTSSSCRPQPIYTV